MLKKRLVTAAVALCAGLPVGVAIGSPASANASDAVEICRQLDEFDFLDDLNITFGECVNLVKGPASAKANNFIAAICGVDDIQDFTDTTNKGQCIKVFRTFFS